MQRTLFGAALAAVIFGSFVPQAAAFEPSDRPISDDEAFLARRLAYDWLTRGADAPRPELSRRDMHDFELRAVQDGLRGEQIQVSVEQPNGLHDATLHVRLETERVVHFSSGNGFLSISKWGPNNEPRSDADMREELERRIRLTPDEQREVGWAYLRRLVPDWRERNFELADDRFESDGLILRALTFVETPADDEVACFPSRVVVWVNPATGGVTWADSSDVRFGVREPAFDEDAAREAIARAEGLDPDAIEQLVLRCAWFQGEVRALWVAAWGDEGFALLSAETGELLRDE